MPTFTFTNNNRRFQAYLYWVTQSGVLEGGLALPSELTEDLCSRPSSRYRNTLYNTPRGLGGYVGPLGPGIFP
jgi:hypothetical protein